MTDHSIPPLSEIHRAYLNDHAISDEVIESAGIWSDGDVIMFPWRDGDQVTIQRRPWPGEAGTYFWEANKPLHLAAWREVAGSTPVLLCEGTKQSLAVASWAPPEYSVYGMAGCRGWANTDLSFFAGSQVIILLDADAGENLDVYEAGERLAARLELEGAFPFFVPSPAWGKEGIDDYLATVGEGRRGAHLARLAADAVSKAITKPAPRKPARRPMQVPDTGLPVVFVNDPLLTRRDVIRQVLGHLKARWDGTELFCYGGGITRLRGGKTEPLGKGAFLRWLAEGVSCYKRGIASVESCWPDSQTVDAMMASGDEFALLERVVKMPFVRADGTISAKNGYDAGEATLLAMGNSGMDRLVIPDAPSQEDAADAARRLLGDWLGDMPFLDQSSRAGALALVLTPFIRGLVPLVPLAVISGRQKGTGKNLFADCLSIVIAGETASPMQWIEDNDDEVRKQVLAAFREGRGLICFDEAHLIRSHVLSRALTAQVYTDRLLGVSVMLSYPNKAVWMALGNNVGVLDDMGRRYHRIDLCSPVPNPEDRPSSDFAHPDLRGWTRSHRPELVTDILVMIRAWFAADCPAHDRGSLMGSFEQWDQMMSGILHYAGVPGFLADMARKRAESDSSGGYWREHLEWLRGNRGNGKPFTTSDVRQDALASLGTWSALPGLDNLTDPGFARKLGQEYSRHRDEWSGSFRLVQVGRGFGNVVKWMVEEFEEPSGHTLPDLGEGQQGQLESHEMVTKETLGSARDIGGLQQEGTLPDLGKGQPLIRHTPSDLGKGQQGQQGQLLPYAHTRAPERVTRERTRAYARDETVAPLPLLPLISLAADIETGDASDLFTYTKRDETGYVRLAGVIGPSGEPVITDGPGLAALLGAAGTVTGHNFLGFDALALAWHCGADYDVLAPKVRDTELIARQLDPPRSRESGTSLDAYGLDAVAKRLGLPGKTDGLARLKHLHGGYDKIPLDDPEYRAYLEGDLRATAAVAASIGHWHDSDPYLPREHRLAALAGRMTLNGLLVDQPLLAERLAEGEARKGEALRLLHDAWGLPLSKTVRKGRGGARHEVEVAMESPLATDEGRAWLAAQYERYQVPDPPRTSKGKLALGADDLAPLLADPRTPEGLRAMLRVMGIVTATRTVYQTATACLAPDGRVHPVSSFRQASGRWSVTNPGLTVFGKRGGRHVERDILLPDPGHVLLSFDLSQVDMRAMAGHSQDPAYMALFGPGRDVHADIAEQVFGDRGRRQDAKAVGHGWNYGLGAARMKRAGMDPGMVDAFIAGMEQRFPVLIAWREQIREQGKAGMILDNGFGRRMRCDPSRAYTVAPALMGQGGARDIMGECLLRLDKSLWPLLRVMVHDEIVVSCPKEDVQDVTRQFLAAMTWEWRGVPIVCDMSGGASWGAASAHLGGHFGV